LAELALIFGQVDAVMEQRPERRIGVAIIIFVHVERGEIDHSSCDAVAFLNMDLARKLLHLLAGPAEPQPPVLPQRSLKRPCQSPLGACGTASLGDRHPIGNYYQPAHRTSFQLRDNKPAQLITPTSESV